MRHFIAVFSLCFAALTWADQVQGADTAEVKLSRRVGDSLVARPSQVFEYDQRRTQLPKQFNPYAPRRMSNLVGNRVALVAGAGYCVYDIKEGRAVAYIGPLKTPLACVGLSADSHMAVTAEANEGLHGEIIWKEERCIRLWDLKTAKETTHFLVDAYSTSSARFASQGELLLATGRLGEPLTKLSIQGKPIIAPDPIKRSVDRHFFADLSHDGSVEICIDGMPAGGASLISAARSEDFKALGSAEVQLSFPFPLSADASQDGRRIVFGEERNGNAQRVQDAGISIVDLAKGGIICRFVSPDPWSGVTLDVPAVAISPDGRRVLAATSLGVHLLDIDARSEVCRFGTTPYARCPDRLLAPHTAVTAVAFAADESKVLVYSEDHRLTVWDLPAHALRARK